MKYTARTTWQHTLRNRARRHPQTEAGGPARNCPVYLTQKERLNLRSYRGQTILNLAGVTPSRRQGTLVEKRSHRNQYTKSPKEGEGQAGSRRKTPGPTASVRTTIGKVRQHTQGTWRSSSRSQEKMGTGKDSDKQVKGAATSHKEP